MAQLQDKFLHVTEIVDAEPKKFLSNAFITSLHNLKYKVIDPSEERPWNAQDLYNQLLSSLGGKLSSRKFSAAELRLPQFVGICTMESVMAVTEHLLPNEVSMRFLRFLSTLKATTAYFKGDEHLLSTSEERRMLLHDGLNALQARAKEVAEDGTVTDQELAYTHSVVDQLTLALKRATEAAADEHLKSIPETTFEAPSVALEETIANVDKGVRPDLYSNTVTVRPHVPIDTSLFSADPKTIIPNLQDLLQQIHQGNHVTFNFLEVQAAIRQIVLKIPLNDPKFWKQINAQQAEQLRSLLTELNKEFLWSFLSNDEIPEADRLKLSADDFVAAWNIFSITNKILREYDNSLGMKIPSLQQNILRSSISLYNIENIESNYIKNTGNYGAEDGSREYAYQQSPRRTYSKFPPLNIHPTLKWRDRLKELITYWQDEENNPKTAELFGFDEYPAGHSGILKRRIRHNDAYIKVREKTWDKYDPAFQKLIPPESGNVYRNDDYAFLVEWARKNPKMSKQVLSGIINVENLSPEDQALQLLIHYERLPPFRDAFITSYILNYFLSGSFSSDSFLTSLGSKGSAGKLDFSKGIRIELERGGDKAFYKDRDYATECWSLNYRLFNLYPNQSDKEKSQGISLAGKTSEDYYWKTPNQVEVGFHLHKPVESILKRLGPVLSSILFTKEITIPEQYYRSETVARVSRPGDDEAFVLQRLRYDPIISMFLIPSTSVSVFDFMGYSHWVANYFKTLDISYEQLRQLFELSSSKLLQVPQTIGYFSKNRHFLTQSEFQVFFKFLLFEDDFLEQWLQTKPTAGEDLARSCRDIYDTAKSIGDINLITFIAGVSNRIEHLYDKEKEKYPDHFKEVMPPKFLDAQGILNGLILSSIPEEKRSLAHRERALLIGTHSILDKETAAQLLESIFYTHFFPVPSSYRDDSSSTEEVDRLIQNQFEKQLIELLNGKDGEEILNQAVTSVLGEKIEGRWLPSEGHLHYISEDGAIKVDVVKGIISFRGGHTAKPFDATLLKADAVAQIFADAPPSIMIPVGEDLLEIRDKRGIVYRISGSGYSRNTRSLLREFDGDWYTLQASEFAKAAFRNQALIAGADVWYLPPVKGKTEKFIFTDSATGRPLYQSSRDQTSQNYNSDKSAYIDHIERLDDRGVRTGDQLVAPASLSLKSFLRVEASEYVVGWGQSGRLTEVNLPRLGLSFKIMDVKGKLVAVCNQFPGYGLVEGNKQFVSELGDVPHYLHLEKEESDGNIKELVIFPRYFLKKYLRGSFITDTLPEIPVEKGRFTAQHRFEYSVKNGELISITSDEQEVIEANAYLAMIHLSEKSFFRSEKREGRYFKARHYLDHAEKVMVRQRKGLSFDAVELLNAVASLDRVTQDHHPEALAIQLKASYLLLKNQVEHSDAMPSRQEKLFAAGLLNEMEQQQWRERQALYEKDKSGLTGWKSVYKDYLTHLQSIDKSVRLDEGEERFLLKYAERDSILNHRLKQLKGEIPQNDLLDKVISVKELSPFLPVRIDTEGFVKSWISNKKPVKGKPEPKVLRHSDHYENFIDYYKIAKNSTTLKDAIPILNQRMGLSIPLNADIESMRFEMEMALKLNLGVSSDSNDELPKELLLSVLSDPSAFMEPEKLESIMHKIEKLTDALEKAKDKYKKQLETIEIQKKGGGDTTELTETFEKNKMEYETIVNDLQKELDVFREGVIDPANKIITSTHLGVDLIRSSDVSNLSERSILERDIAVKRATPAKEDSAFAKSINLQAIPLRTSHTLETPIFPDRTLGDLIKERPVKAKKDTSPVFSLLPKDLSLKTIFEKENADFIKYIKEIGSSQMEYDLIAPDKIKGFSDALAKEIVSAEQQLQFSKDLLLASANRLPARIGLRVSRSMQENLGTEKPLTIDELARAYFQGDYELFHRRNPELTVHEIRNLFSDIQTYLLDSTYLDQQKRILGESVNLHACYDAARPDAEIQEAIRSFIHTASAKREYDTLKYPQYLVYEYFFKILIWEPQVKKMASMSKKDRSGALIEFAMGMGKTHLIGPQMAWLNADGNTIAGFMTLEPLIGSASKDIQEKASTVFHQILESHAIKREPLTVERLKMIYDTLCASRDQRKVLIWTPTDLESLFNQWGEILETGYEAGGLDQDIVDKHHHFTKIFRLLQEAHVLTIDEIHRVMDIQTKLSFTLGLPTSVHQDSAKAVAHIFEAIIDDTSSKHPKLKGISWEFIPHSEGDAFTEEVYHSKIKKKLVDLLLDRNIDPTDEDFSTFFSKMDVTQKEMIRNYLLNTPEDPLKVEVSPRNAYAFLQNPENAISGKVKNQLAVLKEALNVVFPITAGKKPKVHYGLSQDGKLTVPYHDGEATVNSLFGNVLERLLFTAQYGLSQDVQINMIRKEIKAIQDNCKKDQAASRPVDLTRFRNLVGSHSEFDIMNIKESDYPKIAALVDKNIKVKLHLIKEYAFDAIKVYPKQIEASPHILPLMTRKEQGIAGMTGTMHNYATYPNVFQPPELSTTQSMTLDVLRQNSPDTVFTLPKSSSKTVSSIYSHAKMGAGSIIDASGVLSTQNNEALARAMLEAFLKQTSPPSPVEGVVYYDGGVLKVIAKGSQKPILYDRQMNKEKLAALWDLPHTTGSDIPVGLSALATLIVGKHTTLASFMQAAWRLRGLAKGQKINLMMYEGDRNFIKDMLLEYFGEKIGENDDLTLEQMFRYTRLNQAISESDNNYRAVKERMKMALMKRVIDVMWAATTAPSDSLHIYKQTRELFITPMIEEPWDTWGALPESIEAEDALKNMLKSWRQHPIIKEIKANPYLYRGLDLKELSKEWDTIISDALKGNSGTMPRKITSAVSYGSVVEVEQEAEVEAEVEVEVEVETETEMQREAGISYGYSHTLPRRLYISKNIFSFEDESVYHRFSLNELITLHNYGGDYWEMDNEKGLEYNEKSFKYLDEGLLMSHNLSFRKGETGYISPFGKIHKDCSFLQIMQKEGTQEIEVRMLDAIDAEEIAKQILAEREEASKGDTSRKKDLRVALFHLSKSTLNFELEGSQKITLEDPIVKNRVNEMIIQAKFVAGTLEYGPEEIPYLKKWIQTVGPKKAFDITDTILNTASRFLTRKYFATSGLAKIFLELGISKDIIKTIE